MLRALDILELVSDLNWSKVKHRDARVFLTIQSACDPHGPISQEAGGTTSRIADIIDINFNRGPCRERRIPAPLIARLTARACMIDAFEEAEN